MPESLLASEVALGRPDGRVAEQELGVVQFAAGLRQPMVRRASFLFLLRELLSTHHLRAATRDRAVGALPTTRSVTNAIAWAEVAFNQSKSVTAR